MNFLAEISQHGNQLRYGTAAYGADQTSKQDNTIMSAWCLYLSLYQRDWWIAKFCMASYQLCERVTGQLVLIRSMTKVVENRDYLPTDGFINQRYIAECTQDTLDRKIWLMILL